MSPTDSAATRALLEESAWLERLARRLVAEPAQAEDVAQDALVAGLEHPPAAAVPLRRWLAGVLRNLVRERRRRETRRRARELARTVPLAAEGADELAARLELQERLVARVRALPEPYRTTIALRFLADLSTREVAARMQVPPKTVHTRIERALARLREELDREHGGREAWAGLLLPLAHVLPLVPAPLAPSASPAAAPHLLAPLLAMGTIWKWTAAAAALALVGYVVVQERAQPTMRERAVGAPETASPALVSAPSPTLESPHADVREQRTPEEARPLRAETASSAPAPAPRLLSGRVIDVERHGIAGLGVRFQPTSFPDLPAAELAAEAQVTSGADGAFELPLPTERGRILASGHGYATLLAPGLNAEMPPEPPLVVVAPAHDYGGVVVDEQGAPVSGVGLAVRLTSARASELQPGALAGAVPLARFASDAEGRFRVEDVAYVEGVALEVDAGGYERLHLELPPLDDLALKVVLRRPTSSGLAGVVRFADGGPASGALVTIGTQPTRALDDGSFAFALEPGAEPRSVCAALAGFQPARLDLARVPASERGHLVLELGAPALEIRGKVVDAAGEPIAGAEVWTNAGEPFGMVNRRFGEVDFYVQTSVEEVLSSTDGEWSDGRASRSDEAGRFRLSGLLERDYPLLAMHPRTQELAWLARVPAGESEVELVLAGNEPTREVRGRVLNLAGEPVAGALVRVYRQRTLPDGSQTFKQADMDFHAVSDEHGAFRFEALCVAGTHLLLNGEVIAAAQERALDDEPDLLDVLFRAPAVCHVRVFLADPARADSLMLLDERDQPLDLSFLVGSVSLGAQAVSIENGVSDLLRTDESARTLVLSKHEVQERIPIRLTPGAVNELRL